MVPNTSWIPFIFIRCNVIQINIPFYLVMWTKLHRISAPKHNPRPPWWVHHNQKWTCDIVQSDTEFGLVELLCRSLGFSHSPKESQPERNPSHIESRGHQYAPPLHNLQPKWHPRSHVSHYTSNKSKVKLAKSVTLHVPEEAESVPA